MTNKTKATFTTSMFDKIKESINANKNAGSFRNILKTEPGNTYVVRFIPNVDAPERTFFHYYQHGFNSQATGQFTACTCPNTFDERCPICETRFKLYQSKNEADKQLAKLLTRKENWLANVYVVNDPTNSENNGQIKIFRFGRQVYKIISEAIDGEDADEFGPSIFDLSENGNNFRIKVEKNEGGYPTYVSSKFLSKSAIDNLTPDKIKEVYDGIFELDKLNDVKSNDELKEILAVHVFGQVKEEDNSSDDTEDNSIIKDEPEEEDDLPFDQPKKSEKAPPVAPPVKKPAEELDDADQKIKDLLAGLTDEE